MLPKKPNERNTLFPPPHAEAPWLLFAAMKCAAGIASGVRKYSRVTQSVETNDFHLV